MDYDFCGYVTKNNVLCTDGRKILNGAFKHQDGATVPLVYMHNHDDIENVLGHVKLEDRPDGVYGYGYFNDTERGKQAKEMVRHGDLKSLSIFANQLQEQMKQVLHGNIREVSLVLAGANPKATIENVSFAHMDGQEYVSEEDAIISFKEEIKMFEPNNSGTVQHADDGSGKTIQDVYNAMSDEQKKVVAFLVGMAAQGEGGEVTHYDEGGLEMKHNVFEGGGEMTGADQGFTLSHADMMAIFEDAKQLGSLKQAVLAHTGEYGITNITELFPDAHNLNTPPEWITREDEWVSAWLSGTKHSPFSRIKTMTADITYDSARALGYIKGHLKKEEYFAVSKRTTTPATIYKKQKLDRDDIIDITDFDVVAWIKGEMRRMLNYELARAGLIGDGRDPETQAEDKIPEDHIRPVYSDADLYVEKVNLTSTTVNDAMIEAISKGRKKIKNASGLPNFYTTKSTHLDMLWIRDLNQRRIYTSDAELCSVLGANKIVEIDDMENLMLNGRPVIGIMVNPADYTYGTSKGGEIWSTEDFDIDYNQYKYLMECRCCGCLTKPKSAVTFLGPVATTQEETPAEG